MVEHQYLLPLKSVRKCMYIHVGLLFIIIIFSSLALEVTHKKARPVQSVLT